MGTSFTQFNGYGFWARDEYLSGWMAALVSSMDNEGKLTEPQQAFRDALIHCASLCITGAVHDCLDHLAADPALQAWAADAGKRTLATLYAKGANLDGTWLDTINAAEGAIADYTPIFEGRRWPTSSFTTYGEKWCRLITGDFVALPVLDTGLFHGNGEIEVDVASQPPKAIK